MRSVPGALASRRVSLGTERVLTQRELNRALLDRQLLLARRRLGLPRALERIGGLQAQYAPSMYIGLWSRVEGFRRDDLTRALERRSVVQGTLMRATIHLVSAGDYWPFALGVRAARRELWIRIHRGAVTAAELRSAAARASAASRPGTLARAELERRLDTATFNGLGMWLDLVRVPPAGTWERRRADLYATAESWLGAATASPAQGIERLIRRYLQGFGPGAARDIADWAGLPPRVAPSARRDGAAPLPRRAGRPAGGPAARAAARSRHAGPGALPADVGRDAARALPAHADAPRGAPARRSST